MKILVCGAGQVGFSIAKKLSLEGNDVTVIDDCAESIKKISNSLDVKAIVGFSAHPGVLHDAGAENVDMIIAVTSSDETNIVICQISHTLFNVPTKIARIRDRDYLHPKWMKLYRHDHIPIDYIISPEYEIAKAILDRLHIHGSVDTIPLTNFLIKVIGIRCSRDSIAYKNSVRNIQSTLKKINGKILGIAREDQMLPIRSNLDNNILGNDEIFFSCPSENVKQAMKIFGHEEKEARRIIVIGGGNVGESIVSQLNQENNGTKIKLIEIDKDRSQYIAQNVEGITVINGNALSKEILEEANVSMAETVISVSNNDEVNILSSILCKKLGAERLITLVSNSSTYSNIVSSLGIDVAINPREITVSTILKHIRKGRIVSANSICKNNAEIIEAEAVESSTVVGKRISDLDLPDGIVIGNIIRNNQVVDVNDDTIVRPRDLLIILSFSSLTKKVEKIFSVKFEFF